MIRIVFVEPSGRRREVMAAIGTTLMEVARRHGVEGIVAQCGGACACATCHAYADSSGFQRLGPAKDLELSMLELAWEPRPTSRLTCQIRVSAELADMEFTVPARQANQP